MANGCTLPISRDIVRGCIWPTSISSRTGYQSRTQLDSHYHPNNVQPQQIHQEGSLAAKPVAIQSNHKSVYRNKKQQRHIYYQYKIMRLLCDSAQPLSPVAEQCHQSCFMLAKSDDFERTNVPAPRHIRKNAFRVLLTGPFCMYGENMNSCAMSSTSPV